MVSRPGVCETGEGAIARDGSSFPFEQVRYAGVCLISRWIGTITYVAHGHCGAYRVLFGVWVCIQRQVSIAAPIITHISQVRLIRLTFRLQGLAGLR